MNHKVLSKPTDPGYFSGNSNYYQHLTRLNGLVDDRNLDLNLESSKRLSWLSRLEMQQTHKMRLSEKDYEDTIHKLNLLSADIENNEDASLIAYLKKFLPFGRQQVELPSRRITKLDEFNRSLTTASRKTTQAQVYLIAGSGQFYVNGLPLHHVFSHISDREKLMIPFEISNTLGKYNIWASVQKGGFTGAADSIKVAVARGLVAHNPALEPLMSEHNLLKIDFRQVERKKTNKLKARKMPTWVKR